MKLAAWTAAAIVSSASISQAGVVITSALREVSASSDGSSQSFSTTAFGSFVRSASSTGPTLAASANQNSSIDAAGLVISFTGGGGTNLDGISGGAAAVSRMTVDFLVDELTAYSGESYFMPGFPAPQNLPQMTVRDMTSGSLVRSLLMPGTTPVPFSGTLQPGSYRLLIEVQHPNPSGTTTGGSQSVMFDVTFVPTPATLVVFGLASIRLWCRKRRPDRHSMS